MSGNPNIRKGMWWASLILGASPLVVHGLLFVLVTSPQNWIHNWTGDFAFMGIGLATATLLELMHGPYRTVSLSDILAKIFVLGAVIILGMIGSAVIYAISAVGLTAPSLSAKASFMFFLGIGIPSYFITRILVALEFPNT